MTERNQPTPEEIAAQRDASRNIGLANLGNSYLKTIASAKLADPTNYGKVGEGMYEDMISQTPDDSTYQQLFVPALTSEEGNASRPGLQNSAAKIMQQSLSALKVSDFMGYIGAKLGDMPEGLSNSYIADVKGSKEMEALRKQFMNYALTEMVESSIAQNLSGRKEKRISGLEEIFTKPDEEESQ